MPIRARKIARFRSGENPSGVGCLMQNGDSQYVVIAPDIVALRKVMGKISPGFALDEKKCKPTKLMPVSSAERRPAKPTYEHL